MFGPRRPKTFRIVVEIALRQFYLRRTVQSLIHSYSICAMMNEIDCPNHPRFRNESLISLIVNSIVTPSG